MNIIKRPGILYALLAPLGFSLMNVLAKYTTHHLPSIEVVFFRSLFSLIILAAIIFIKNETLHSKQLPLLIMRGIFGALGLIGVFYTLAHLKLADASILLQLNPIFVALFALLFLKERPPKRFGMLLSLALFGAVLMIRPSFETGISFAALVGIISAIMAAAAYTCVRQLAKNNSTNIIIFYYMLVAAILSSVLAYQNYMPPTNLEWLALIGIGMTSSMAQIFLTKAYQLEKASVVAMLSYIAVLLHFTWGYLLWGETLDLFSLFGAIFIIGPCALLVLKKK